MAQEQHGLLGLLDSPQRVLHAGREFWRGGFQGHDVVLVLSRIGKVAAATTATALIDRFAVRRMVFTGVAGGLGPGVNVGDIVVAGSFLQHDLDASPIFPKYEVPLYGLSRFASDPVMTAALARASSDAAASPHTTLGAVAVTEFGLQAPRVHQGLVVSGDRFVSTTAESQALQFALPDALACEMEGAAVAQVCHDYGVPFAAVRTISDRADDAAHVDFARFIESVASRYAMVVVQRFLGLLPPI
jgi:adenosylhomocysteine nucleosidase